MKFESKWVKVENSKITFKKLVGQGDTYSTSMIMNIKETRHQGILHKIGGVIKMLFIISIPYGIKQFNGKTLLNIKIQENPRATAKEFVLWLTPSEYDEFMKAIE